MKGTELPPSEDHGSNGKGVPAAKAGGRRRRGGPVGGNSRDPSPRDRLIEVAIPLFAKFGYEAVSTGRIARAANLSQPMVHYHFKSKALIWRASMEHLMEGLSRTFPEPP